MDPAAAIIVTAAVVALATAAGLLWRSRVGRVRISAARDAGAQSAGAQSAGAQSAGAQSAGAQSAGAQASAAQGAGAQSAGAQPAGAQASAAQEPGARGAGEPGAGGAARTATGPDLGELLGFADAAARPGDRVTLLQFSTDHCTYCGPTRRALQRIAADRPGVVHAEINLEEHPELAGRLAIMQTPTTLVFDGAGGLRGRIGGAPRIPELVAALASLEKENHVAHA